MRRPLLLATAVLLPLAACSDGGTGSGKPTGTGPTLRLERGSLTLGDADSTRLSVTVIDEQGRPAPNFDLPAPLQWTTTNGGVAVAEAADGATRSARVRATGVGAAWVHVRSGSMVDSASVSVQARLLLQRLSPEEGSGAPGAPLADSLAVRVTDPRGAPVAGATVVFTVTEGGGSVSPATATSRADGVARTAWKLGDAPGPNAVSAAAQMPSAVGAQTTFRASGVGGGPVQITAIAPEVLVPGATATITGTGFGANPAALPVRVDGVSAQVTAATPTQLTVTLAAATEYACRPVRPVEVSVGGAVRLHPLRAGKARELAPGEAVDLSSAVDAACADLPAGSYLVNAVNGGTAPTARVPFRLEGGSSASAPAQAARIASSSPAPASAARLAEARAEAAHLRIMQAGRDAARRLGAPRWPSRGARRSAAAATPAAEVGEQLAVRVPRNACTVFTEVTARVAYAGTRVAVLEDAAAPLAGQMDDELRRAGAELDGRMMDILLQNFGNPLGIHAPGGGGRVLALVSPRVNATGSLGFASPLDFYPRNVCPASNEAPVIYIVAPTGSPTAPNPFTGTAAQWYRTMRTTLIHETKHLASISERLSRNGVDDVGWLDESTARIAEEIWARDYYANAQFGEAGYDPAVRCSAVECAGKPYGMLKHFGGLYNFLSQPDLQTPLGQPAVPNSSFYGSAWSLVRWAADHSGNREQDFFRALTQEPLLPAAPNLVQATGRPFGELLADWSVALVTDGRPGFTPANPRHTFPSWRTGDVFAGMARDSAASYRAAQPLVTTTLSPGAFEVEFPGVYAGSFIPFSLAVPGTRAVIGLRGPGGGDLHPNLRLVIVRVQ